MTDDRERGSFAGLDWGRCLVNFLFEVHENNSSFLKFLISAFGKFTLRLFRFEHSGPNYKIPFCIFILLI